MDKLLLPAVVASFSASLLLFTNPVNYFFAWVDLAFASLFLILFFLRSYVNFSVKTIAILVSITVHGAMSLVYSGLMGTGILFLLLIQVIAIVFLPRRYALLVGWGTILYLLIMTLLVQLRVLVYAEELIIKMNQGVYWGALAIGVIIFFLVSYTIISVLKDYLQKNVVELQVANEILQDANRRLQASQETVELIAYTDKLTGLPNRYKFEQMIRERQHQYGVSGFFLLFNIKGFRIINSLLGQEVGDEVLAILGTLFRSYSSRSVLVARLESDEFAGWVEGWDEQTLDDRIIEFHTDFYNRLPQRLISPRIEFFISVVAFPEEAASTDECFRKAGIALRYAKDSGSTGVMRFYPPMMENMEAELRMRKLLERAIENQDFQIHYQNKINLKTGLISGAEALARWNSPELGSVSPSDFVPVLNKYQLMIPFGKIIFEKILVELPLLKEKIGQDISVAINISPLFFLKPGFADYIIDTINAHNIVAKQVTLELTEDVFIEDISKIGRIITRLRVAGIKISLDDFGKGFSSLHYMSRITLDELKVDKSFVDDICCDKKSFGLFSSICNLAQILDFKVVAEGVESQEQVDELKKTTCDMVQGFFFARPEPL